jgi:DNA repair protein RadC
MSNVSTPRPRRKAADNHTIQAALRILEQELAPYGPALNSPTAAREYLRLKIAPLEHEVFVAIWLDPRNRVIEIEEMFRGTICQTGVYPREVVKSALRHNAGAVMFAHNHPSGLAEPSDQDQALTQALQRALQFVDVRVLDHFVVGADSVMSFAERGLL